MASRIAVSCIPRRDASRSGIATSSRTRQPRGSGDSVQRNTMSVSTHEITTCPPARAASTAVGHTRPSLWRTTPPSSSATASVPVHHSG